MFGCWSLALLRDVRDPCWWACERKQNNTTRVNIKRNGKKNAWTEKTRYRNIVHGIARSCNNSRLRALQTLHLKYTNLWEAFITYTPGRLASWRGGEASLGHCTSWEWGEKDDKTDSCTITTMKNTHTRTRRTHTHRSRRKTLHSRSNNNNDWVGDNTYTQKRETWKKRKCFHTLLRRVIYYPVYAIYALQFFLFFLFIFFFCHVVQLSSAEACQSMGAMLQSRKDRSRFFFLSLLQHHWETMCLLVVVTCVVGVVVTGWVWASVGCIFFILFCVVWGTELRKLRRIT